MPLHDHKAKWCHMHMVAPAGFGTVITIYSTSYEVALAEI